MYLSDKSLWYGLLLSIYQGEQLQQRKTLYIFFNIWAQDTLQTVKKNKSPEKKQKKIILHPWVFPPGFLRTLESVAIAGSKEVADCSFLASATCHGFFFRVFFVGPRKETKLFLVWFSKKKQILLRSSDVSVLSSVVSTPPNTGSGRGWGG